MKNKGFTLVEILVTLLIVGLLTTLIFVSIDSTQKSTSGIERKVTAQEDAKVALSLMEMEIRMASYNPQFTSGNWVSASCTSASGSQNYRGIQVATANSLTIQADINGNCSNDNTYTCMTNAIEDDPNEIISYNYDTAAANRHISRATNCGAQQPFLGAAGTSPAVKTVSVINNELGLPVFRYFDGVGNDISATVASSPADNRTGIPAIRRIDITLAVETQFKDPMIRDHRRMIYTTSVIVRNHAPLP